MNNIHTWVSALTLAIYILYAVHFMQIMCTKRKSFLTPETLMQYICTDVHRGVNDKEVWLTESGELHEGVQGRSSLSLSSVGIEQVCRERIDCSRMHTPRMSVCM